MKKHIVIITLNVFCILGFLVLTLTGKHFANSQGYNTAYERWRNGGEENYAQISCFLADDSGFDTDSVQAVRAGVVTALQGASIVQENGKKLAPDSYSSYVGVSTIRCDITGRSEAEITAVGGNFFLFRNFRLLDGAYFSEDDVMQDGAVIDRSLAWALYGSVNVSGMNIYIDGVKFYISGVIENPKTKPEQKCAGDTPKIYLSYDGVSNIQGGNEYKKISCYESIMPDPVENFAYNALNNYFEGAYKYKYSITVNSERFNPSERAKAFKTLSDYAVKDNTISYPYWENASRIIEFRLTVLYFLRNLLVVPVVLTVIWLIIKLYKAVKIYKKKLFTAIIDNINKKIYNHKQKKVNT